MRILNLTLKKQWYDMIASGEKKEEYRENKVYWDKRLAIGTDNREYRKFDIVRFRNGYAKDAPTIDVEFKGITFGYGKPEWGAKNEGCFIIKLGSILT